jgi:signal transduction histidine kinase
MATLSRNTLLSLILVFLLILILTTLALLQYRWSGEVSEAVQERMRTSLLISMDQFRHQFNDEFQQIEFLLRPDPNVLDRKEWKSYAESCSSALDASESHLVRNVYLWIPISDGSSQLLRLERNSQAFSTASWPAELQPVKDRYSRFFANPQGLERRPFAWTMNWQIPLLMQSLFAFRGDRTDENDLGFQGYLLVELSFEAIRARLLPELARKCFEGPDGFIYHIAVLAGNATHSAVYRSDSSLNLSEFAQADARIRLFDTPGERPGPGIPGMAPPGGNVSPRPPPPVPFGLEPFRAGARGIAPPVSPLSDDEDLDWELVAKHREGSLEKAVAGLRRRNLAISFGILLLLGLSVALIVVYARRAQRLAQLQIDFVAGISHELRTPLAVICSASDNLAEGVVPHSGKSTRRYGELIRSEGRKLAGMIEQILQFASVRRGRQYNLRPARINEIVTSVLEQTKPLVSTASVSIETSFAPDLPLVNVDASALSQAIQNVIQNAIKYSGESRWLAVRTEKLESKRDAMVQVVVEDRGLGIARDDLPHIFEPFYRGGAAKAAQIHGTGLGLFMAREAVAAMGGRITAESSPGKRAVFAIQLPALQPEAADLSSRADQGTSSHAL